MYVAAMSLRHGDVVMRREVWRGTAHLIYPVRVVEDAGDLLTLFLASGTPLLSPEGSWPWSDAHPWAAEGLWRGHGVLQILSAVGPVSTWVFWSGEERDLDAWYINLQEPFRRTRDGIETQDLELDFVVAPDGSWKKKDDELLDAWVERGRWSVDEIAGIRDIGSQVETELRAGHRWWDERWAAWEPPSSWEPWAGNPTRDPVTLRRRTPPPLLARGRPAAPVRSLTKISPPNRTGRTIA
jgi:hypothetical protein